MALSRSPSNQECVFETGQTFNACADDMPFLQLFIAQPWKQENQGRQILLALHTMRYGVFSVANQNQGAVVLNSTARNLNTWLFRGIASFNNKTETNGLILPCCEDQIPLRKELTDTPTGSLCSILIHAPCS